MYAHMLQAQAGTLVDKQTYRQQTRTQMCGRKHMNAEGHKQAGIRQGRQKTHYITSPPSTLAV